MKIKKLDEKDLTALYHRYPRETSPQGCYVEIDLDNGTMRADWDGEIGGAVPFSVWHGRVRRYGLPPYCLPGAVNKLMEELLPFAERMATGYSCEWDGSNHKGRLTGDARSTEETLAAVVASFIPDETEMLQVRSAVEYYESYRQEHEEMLNLKGEDALRADIDSDQFNTDSGSVVFIDEVDEYIEYLKDKISGEED